MAECARKRGLTLASLTTIGIGGMAEETYFPKNRDELFSIFERFPQAAVIGGGSNVLAPDEGLPVVISTRACKSIEIRDGLIWADVGVSVPQLSAYAKSASLTGWEFLTGIPATIGGLTAMNAGCSGVFMSDIVLCVEAVEGGNRVLYETEYCGFGKKTSRFLQKQLILSVALDLRFADRHSIEARERAYRERRKGLPSGKSMGCVFLNGDGYAAAKLIDEAGLKGKRIGGAVVSASHANFILNDGDATAKDVRELIAYIKRTVLDRSGVLLMEEIIRL